MAVFCAAIILVALAAGSVELAERRIWVAQQQTKVDDVASTFERQAATNAAYLAAMGSLLGNVNTPSPQVFRNYVAQLRGISELNGVIGLGWIERFDAEDLPDLKARLRLPSGNREADDAAIAPTIETLSKWPVYLIGMLEGTPEGRWTTTLDSGEGDRWVAVMDRVMTSGIIGTGDWTEGVPAGRLESPAFIVLAPAPSADGEPKFEGVAFGLVRTRDFATDAIDPDMMEAGQIEIVQRVGGGEKRIFWSQAHSARLAAPVSKNVRVFDQDWTLRYWPQARSGLSILSMVILFGGAAFALLLLA